MREATVGRQQKEGGREVSELGRKGGTVGSEVGRRKEADVPEEGGCMDFSMVAMQKDWLDPQQLSTPSSSAFHAIILII